MVFARLVAVLAVVSVAARGACGLSLEGVRPPHGASRPLSLAPNRRLGPRDSDLLPDDQALALMSDAAPRYEEAQLGELDDPHTSYRLKHLISELAEAIAAAEALDVGAYGGPLPAELSEALAAAEGLEGGDGRPCHQM
ncbi:uncharacterized protein LOC123513179 [Portunus trituberculatus]|uniref:uncharacterized protein LOC123513179 n=1 Tax=Portunus trituberculatus TaxID=210409 RepID=UPI001E1CE265|nr:uncharacterized protein LOC123513179 [Portunus trituberculatus]XP_045126080.1 uncharacterized protein LOC123513179 [Portunus trituberculatus]XP_045126091.1 uncharacterized protein LOC123513179 [Portunus trituberculatus]